MKDKLAYNADKDIAYLHLMAAQPNLLVVHPSVPAKNAARVHRLAEGQPGPGLRHLGHRLEPASVRRNADADGRHQDEGGRLSRLQSADAGPDRRPDQDRLRQLLLRLGAGEGRQRPRTSPSRRPSAIRSRRKFRHSPRRCRVSRCWPGSAGSRRQACQATSNKLTRSSTPSARSRRCAKAPRYVHGRVSPASPARRSPTTPRKSADALAPDRRKGRHQGAVIGVKETKAKGALVIQRAFFVGRGELVRRDGKFEITLKHAASWLLLMGAHQYVRRLGAMRRQLSETSIVLITEPASIQFRSHSRDNSAHCFQLLRT